jgi:hypothetical protein
MVAGLRLFLKAEIKHAGISYEELAARLMDRGLKENSASLANKLASGTLAATWFLAWLAVLEMDGIKLEDI